MATKKPLTPDQKFIAQMQLTIVDHEKRIRKLERKIKELATKSNQQQGQINRLK
jgi:hypothetical protein